MDDFSWMPSTSDDSSFLSEDGSSDTANTTMGSADLTDFDFSDDDSYSSDNGYDNGYSSDTGSDHAFLANANGLDRVDALSLAEKGDIILGNTANYICADRKVRDNKQNRRPERANEMVRSTVRQAHSWRDVDMKCANMKIEVKAETPEHSGTTILLSSPLRVKSSASKSAKRPAARAQHTGKRLKTKAPSTKNSPAAHVQRTSGSAQSVR